MEERAKLDQLFARAVFAGGLALSTFNTSHWDIFSGALRPSYKPPSPYRLSNSLLDAEYSALHSELSQKCANAETVGVQIDGWSDIRNDGICHSVVTTPDPILAKIIESGGVSQDAEFYAGKICAVIDEVGPQKVLGVGTDNASVMTASWKIVELKYAQQGIQIFCYGCAAHEINLFMQDLGKIEPIKVVFDYCSALASEFKNSHELSSGLRKTQREDSLCPNISIKKPGKTRWGSNLDCVGSVLVNRRAVKKMAADDNVRMNPITRRSLLEDIT